jgi:hypothetical protein
MKFGKELDGFRVFLGFTITGRQTPLIPGQAPGYGYREEQG